MAEVLFLCGMESDEMGGDARGGARLGMMQAVVSPGGRCGDGPLKNLGSPAWSGNKRWTSLG